MKHNHWPSFWLVVFSTMDAVASSVAGEFGACFWALFAAALGIFYAKSEEQLARAIQLAKESNEGWKQSQAQVNRLLFRREIPAAPQPSLDGVASPATTQNAAPSFSTNP